MAVQSGVLEQMEAHGMGAVGEEQGLCALELASSIILRSVVGMAPVRWPVLLALAKMAAPATAVAKPRASPTAAMGRRQDFGGGGGGGGGRQVESQFSTGRFTSSPS